jgi:diguanylate cyclase (GGDEF)-like protein
MAVADITHPDDLATSLAALDDAVTGRGLVNRAEKRYIRSNGSHVWVAISSSVIRLESGESLHAITQVEDITARKAAETELTWLVTHDPLTRLLNRAGLHEHLVAALRESQLAGSAETGSAETGSAERGSAERGSAETQPAGALLYCDLDGFKTVNDTHGHDIGDRVLRVAANRLTEHVRDRDGVARLGGDEFVVVAHHVTLDEAIALAERIVGSLAEPLQIDGTTVQITISVGIAPLSDVSAATGPDVAALLHIADTAMYQAKANGRNGHAVRRRADS